MPANEITLYVGLGVVVFGAITWVLKKTVAGENSIEIPGFNIKLREPAIVIMAIGVILVFISQTLPGEEIFNNNKQRQNTDTPRPDQKNDRIIAGQPAVKIDENPENTSRRPVMGFRIEIVLNGGNNILKRNWRRVSDVLWAEIYPEGKKDYFDVVGQTTIEGCSGVVARMQENESHKVFISDKGCSGMPFYINDSNRGWGFASEMYDVH